MTVRPHRRGVEKMRPSDLHFWADDPPHALCGVPARVLLAEAVLRDAAEAKREFGRRMRGRAWRFENSLFGLDPIEKLRRRSSLEAILLGRGPGALGEKIVHCHANAMFGDGRAAWLDKFCGTPAWRPAGVGVARADLRSDGTWDFWAHGDMDAPGGKRGGAAVITIPEFDGFEPVDIWAIELAPNVERRRTGRVYSHTGLSCGLGVDSLSMLEWRHWSTRLALVATPLDWLRAHAVVPETGRTVPALDGQPCVWLAGLDDALGAKLDVDQAIRTEELLCAADPLLACGRDPDFGFLVQARLDAARRRRMPPKPDVMVFTPDDEPGRAEGEAA